MHRATLLTCSILLILGSCFSQDTSKTGTVRGTVFTKDPGGKHLVLPGARVTLLDARTIETQSDAQGVYIFDSVAPGRHTVGANAPGLSATLEVEVKAGGTSVAPIELGVAAVTSSVTVAATDPSPIEESAQHITINQSTVEAAPNQNERFDSLLPLVPGVDRGPDGRINLKGSRSTQSGWLVNSADVTDPATGSEALNLPIDVVSS